MILVERRAFDPPDLRLRRVTAPIVLIGAFLFLGACSRSEPLSKEPSAEPAPDNDPGQVLELTPGTALTHDGVEGEVRTYRIRLEKGEYAHVVVDQQGADVLCELSDSQNESLLAVDNMAGAWGPEEVFWVAEADGEFHLLIRTDRVEGEGRYSLTVRSLGPARLEDRRRAQAVRLFDTGERLLRAGAESYLEAVSFYEKALSIYHELGEENGEGEVLYRLGFIRRHRSEWRQALLHYERAGPFFEAAGNVRMHSVSLHQMGRSYYFLGEIESAIPCYRRALQLRMELGDRRWQAATLNNLGVVNAILGEFQEALNLYDQALERWREMGDRSGEAISLHSRGRCYLYLGGFQQALDDLSQALKIREEIGDLKRQEATLIGLGLVHEELAGHGQSEKPEADPFGDDQGKLQKALNFLERALAIGMDTGNRPGQAFTLSIMGRIYGRLNEESQALQAFDQARQIFRDLGARHHEAFALYDKGTFLYSLGKTDEALAHLREALPLLYKVGRQHVVDALAIIASAEHRRGNLEVALEYIEEALEKTEALRSKPASHELRSSFFALRQNHYETNIEILMDLDRRNPRSGYDAKALAVSERARARSLLEALIESGADLRRGADQELLARDRTLEKEVNKKELQRLRLLDEDVSIGRADRVAAVERELRKLLREYEQVRAQIRLSNPTYTALTQPTPLGPREIQQKVLDEETLLLEYKLGSERSYVWAVTRNSISSYELPPRAQVESLAWRVYDLLIVSNRRESRMPIRSAIESLSEMLISPVARHLPGRRLLIVSEGALQYIPFSALQVSAKVSLLANHEITYTPSASTFAELRRRLAARTRAPGLIAVVADPVFQSHDPRFRQAAPGISSAASRDSTDLRRFERLVFAEQEAAAILDLVPEDKRFQALGFAANLETVTGGDLSRYQIIHFATHAYVDAEHPELSRLVLSMLDEDKQPREGFLFAHEIYNLDLPAELVVLSACRTALGKRVRGEGLVGLTQAFMYAGAARVLVSLWPVNDQATAELMARFYRYLLVDEMGPAAALRTAQLSIAGETRWQAPYYWAGFVLQGEW